MENILKNAMEKLNPEQREAVDTIYWPVMVVAWPGTWKTQIISLRTANILLKAWVEPKNILITTFTDAWVIAIRKRLSDFLWTESYKVNVCTIHSLCNDIIAIFPEKFLEYRAYRLIDDIEAYELIENIIDTWSFEALVSEYDKYYYVRTIKDKIWKLKQEWILPDDFWKIIEKQREDYKENLTSIDPKLKKYENTRLDQEKHIKKLEELHVIYSRFLETTRQIGVYDFADMIDFVLRKLKEDESLRLYYAERFQFIMVDEYQDTNNAQNEIIDLILSVSDEKNVLCVWDDDQSIYRFQWANLENMLKFSTKYPQTKFVVLKENYRSNASIITSASQSIKNNASRITNYITSIEKRLNSNSCSTNKASLSAYHSDMEEKAGILSKINELKTKLPEEEISIIVRTNKEVEEWSKFLEANSISAKSKLNSNVLDSKFVWILISLLEIIRDPFSDESKVADILRSSMIDISRVEVLKLLRKLSNMNFRLKEKKKIFDILLDDIEMENLYPSDIEVPQTSLFWEWESRDHKSEFKNFRDKVIDCQQAIWWDFYEFFRKTVEEFSFVTFVEKNGNFEDILDIFSLLEHTKSWTKFERWFTLDAFLKRLNYYRKYSIMLPRHIKSWSKIWVNVMTAHQSKWLEFQAVFVPNLVDWNWWKRKTRDLLKLPFWVIWSNISESLGNEDELEEERRLFFVALTRAKDELFLSFPMWSDTKAKLQCQYVQETGLQMNLIEWVDLCLVISNDLDSKIRIERLYKEEEEYILEFLKNYKLSPSDLNKFIEDPKMFLRDVIFKYPFEDNKFTIFWKVYHKALEYFYLEFKKTWVHPWISFIQNKFSWLLSQEMLSPEDYESLKEKWLSWLAGWYDMHDSWFALPAELEYDFRPRNIILDWIPLTWKIDKIEEVFSREVRLVDYKTWKPKSTNEIIAVGKPSDWKYFRQLLFYKIMFDLDSNLTSRFDSKELVIEFVEWRDWKYPKINIPYVTDDIERVKAEIKESWDKINDISFWRELIG